MTLSTRFDEALVLAHDLHREQVRKGSGTPYVAHLLGVASLALEHGATEDEAIAALLHDAVEDQGGLPTLDDIRSRFGDAVADIVLACTDAFGSPKPPWRERKEAYLAHLDEATPSALLISACDKAYNARTIARTFRTDGEHVFERFSGGPEGTRWYYAQLLDKLRGRVPAALHGELERSVATFARPAG